MGTVTLLILLLAGASSAPAAEPAGAATRLVAYMPAGFSFGSAHMAGTVVGGTLSLDGGRRLSFQVSGSRPADAPAPCSPRKRR